MKHVLLRLSMMRAQLDVESNHWAVNVDAIVPNAPVRLAITLRQVKIRNMHEIQTRRHGVTRTKVIAHSAAHIYGKSDVLSLRIRHALRSLGVNAPHPKAYIKVRSDLRL